MLSAGLLALRQRSRTAAEAVTVRLKWLNQAQFAGYYVAKDKGYYEKAGLDVSIQPGGSDFPAIQMVAGGSEQFGVTGADQILIARSKGVPVVAIAVIYRENPFVLFALKKSGITKAAQTRRQEHRPQDRRQRGADLSRRAQERRHRQRLAPRDAGQVRSVAAPHRPGRRVARLPRSTRCWRREEKGFETSVIRPADYGVDMYADTLFTTERMLKEKPDVVKKFVAATIHGWADAVAEPEAAARTTVKFGNKLEYAHELAMMKASVPLIKAGKDAIGVSKQSEWEEPAEDADRCRLPEDQGRRRQGLHQRGAAE